jgi:hypothetical protein
MIGWFWWDDFWRRRAGEAYLAAEEFTHPGLKRELLWVAVEFERLANRKRTRIQPRLMAPDSHI